MLCGSFLISSLLFLASIVLLLLIGKEIIDKVDASLNTLVDEMPLSLFIENVFSLDLLFSLFYFYLEDP